MNFARVACLVLLFWPTLAVADTRSVEVYGVGSVAVDPDIAYLEGQLYGSGETVADAQESFEKRKADFNSAINPKSFEGVEVTFEGVTTSRVPEGGDDMGMAVRVMGMAGDASSAIETMYGITSQGEGPETSTTGLGKINVRLKLRVKFELLDQ